LETGRGCFCFARRSYGAESTDLPAPDDRSSTRPWPTGARASKPGTGEHHDWIVLAVARECKCLPGERRPIPEAFTAAANSRTLGLLVGVGCEIGVPLRDSNRVPAGYQVPARNLRFVRSKKKDAGTHAHSVAVGCRNLRHTGAGVGAPDRPYRKLLAEPRGKFALALRTG
jgi:hypothetical protein